MIDGTVWFGSVVFVCFVFFLVNMPIMPKKKLKKTYLLVVPGSVLSPQPWGIFQDGGANIWGHSGW